MADEEPQLATKAPESDLHAKHTHGAPNQPVAAPKPPTAPSSTSAAPPAETTTPAITSDPTTTTTANTSAYDHCTSDRPTPRAAGTPGGEILDLNGVQSYIAKPAAYPADPCKLLLLLTGGTGLHSANNQLQADAYAARGFVVVMPDLFDGDAAPNTRVASASTSTSTAAAGNTAGQEDGAASDAVAASWLERFKLGAAETAKSFLLDMWLARHTPERVHPIVARCVAGAREAFGDALANGAGLYGVGYCFGAKYILHLLGRRADADAGAEKAADDEEKAGEPELKAGAIAHGTLVTKADVERVRRPVRMVCVAGDALFADDVREQGRAALELNGVPHDVSVWEGVPHGFAVVGDYEEAAIREKQAAAFEDMAAWLEQF